MMRNFAFAFGCVLVIYLITSPFAIAQVDLTISGLSAVAGGNTYNNLAFGVSNGGGADGFGKFGYNITGIGIPGQNGITSVSSLTFTITSNGAITPADIIGMFNAQGADFAIHFCDGAGTNCSPFTGDVVNGQVP